ncbi:MAG: efflux RND transporter periplasmic adaptor subunit [Bacteroidaceae bacterium]|nr:efflux RND transporter periplasmic adaptor subunit [Bacteroidaceae bacterium]
MKYSKFSVVILSVAVAVASCTDSSKTVSKQVSKPVVKVSSVIMEPVPQTRTYAATIQSDIKNNIASSTPGRIDKILVEVGDYVKKGQTLVLMDSANLNKLALQIRTQEIEFERITELYNVGATSKSAYENAEMSLEVNRTALENLMENTRLVSPIEGYITARNYDEGDLYQSQAILQVQSIRPVKMLIDVSETFFSKVAVGNKVSITVDAYPGETFQGKVSLIYPIVNASTHTFTVEVMIENKDEKLRPGMFARASLNFGDENHVVVPDVAIVKRAGTGDRFVYLYSNGKVVFVPVVLGQRLADRYELISGVESGDQVVIAGQAALSDGMEVEVSK